MSYSGSCHCGAVTFEVEGELPASAVSCNCSHCRRHGLLLTMVSASSVSFTSGEEMLSDYFFNNRVIRHRFCKRCGSQPLAESKDGDGTENRTVNLRCVPDCDLEVLEIVKFDGASY